MCAEPANLAAALAQAVKDCREDLAASVCPKSLPLPGTVGVATPGWALGCVMSSTWLCMARSGNVSPLLKQCPSRDVKYESDLMATLSFNGPAPCRSLRT